MWRILSRFGLVITATGAVLAVTVAALVVPLGLLGRAGSGEPAGIEMDRLQQRSYIWAADGTLLATLHGEYNRQPVELADVPPHVVSAILAVEDQGFWTHDGVDGRGLLRAFSVNVGEGDVAQGGSTITQQLVKLSVLSAEKTLDRKVQEIVLARRLEREMTKEQILEQYLNTVYFGNHAYGIQAAAETYFGVSANALDVGHAAFLAGMIRNPSAYNPVRHPEAATDRRNVALERMQEEGVVNEAEATLLAATPVPTEVHEVLPQPDDYFVEEVKQQLLDDPRLGATREARERAVFTGGLNIHTTFDPRAQQLALAARDEHLGAGGTFDTGQPLIDQATGQQVIDPNTGQPATVWGTASMVSVEPATGAVRAMVGGPGFEDYRYNLATQTPPRQVGSSFKTFVLATLMEQGFSPNDVVDGTSPCFFKNPPGSDQEFYEPSNYEGAGGGVDTITKQTISSVNCAYVRLGLIAGMDNVVDTARRLGISTQLDPYMSTALGSQGAPVIEMAGAYAAFANDGVLNPPYYIDRVLDAQGKVIWEHAPAPSQAVQPQTARLVTQVLETNVTSGTGRPARLSGRRAAGKTGTTQENADGWFVGYTPQLATAVWMGGMGAQVPITLGGRRLTGGSYPAQIWGSYMNAWHEGQDALDFLAPATPASGRFLEAPRDIDPLGQGPPPPTPPTTEPGPPGPPGPPGRETTVPTVTISLPVPDPTRPTLPGPPIQQTTSTLTTEPPPTQTRVATETAAPASTDDAATSSGFI